ncbi:MAG TPA: UDP-N-acetylmuramate dehydrogenase [Nitrospirae bacterium]|nr:UDP-N-acetylenolpyruvoylglucosamine reductase [bacterium BMS3Abin06]HDH12461.1 UDP-N-acetylmuramate dehydrogenase [Nitrospirota bacterium]HDZ02402.1 UDP-N-acetylmuramate dehydrogenase [Nitrospirota bacterium]
MKDMKSEIKELIKGEIKFDEPMSAHTSLKIGGPVEIMVFPEDPVSLKNILLAAEKENIPVFVFGAGTNLLAGDGKIEGIAVSLRAFRNMELTRETDDNHLVLYVGSGVPLALLVNLARKNGYSGIEALAGIPGYIGGAVYMNAGSFGTEIRDVVVSVAIMNTHGDITIMENDKLCFSYRSANLPEGSIILSANFVLKRDDPVEVGKRTEEFLKKKKAVQPLGEFSAGCVFKNPAGDAAGRLIDAVGCKGMRAGDLEVSSMHANYFINKGKATCRDFIKLMETVKLKVKEYSGIELEPEVKIIGSN